MKKEKAVDELLEAQWETWQKNNPLDSFRKVTDEQLREALIADLEPLSKMNVAEYTLYKKFVEIKERYPVEILESLFDDNPKSVIKNPAQEQVIKEVKSNIWFPKGLDDYQNIDPYLIYTAADSTADKKSKLPEVWNTIRTFNCTMKNNNNVGRNLNYIVADKVTGKYLGVICLSSDFMDLTPRDKVIGWNKDVKTLQKMINFTAIGSSIVPFQPLGYNYVGGKLLALLCLSDEVQMRWKEQYGDTLVGVTTTSLYGKTKVGGLSQYDGLEHWLPMGYTQGSIAYDPSRKTLIMLQDWLKTNYTRDYFEWYYAKKPTGQPYKRDHKNRSLIFTYNKLKIPQEIYRSDHARGIYFSPLYDNTYEFLRKEITEDKLVKSFDTSYEALTEIWKKLAKVRIKQLVKKNKVITETLFYDDIIHMSWEETKEKYLVQVGR